jgi:periplasmic divalent cation tolerance protein
METYVVYMTASSREEAARIGRALVEQRLAACVNILGDIDSVYWWDNAVQSAQEVAFIAKTTRDKIEALAAAVKSLHSYDVPCVAAMPIVQGLPAFLHWIEEETRTT